MRLSSRRRCAGICCPFRYVKKAKFLRLSYQSALMDTEEAIGLVVFGALICVFILLVAVAF
jgi:hypothetical protein